ncbi:MAG: DUF4332 domain-containing protein, partial [Nitrosospira sp.]|nr:DUF4332 domain-containing protein [Nitrosospira sp.]
KSARIRGWFGQRKEDGFPGNHLNNAIFATFALSWFGRLRASSYALREIVDLDSDAERALHAIGIRDTSALLNAFREPDGPELLGSVTQKDSSCVGQWAQQAELMQRPGIGGDDAFLLVAAGVKTAADLAGRNATDLHAKLDEVAAKLGIADFKQDLKVTGQWVRSAS